MGVKILIRTILIDDERPALKVLEYQLKQYDYIKIVGQYTDVVEAIEKIKQSHLQLVFLDIEMPKMKGIEAAEKILTINDNIHIIFVTAHNHYAIEAFEVDAMDYIMKPVIKRRLDKTMNKIIKRIPVDDQEKPIQVEKENNNKILCFDNLQWISHSRAIKWRTAKTKELIAFLLHHKGKFVHRDKIIENLWPDKQLDNSIKLLHTSIYNARKALKSQGNEDRIIFSNEMYKLNIEDVFCDVFEFDKMTAGDLEISQKNITQYEKVVQLYTGGYFQENDYLWIKDEQERLDYIYINLLKHISAYYMSQEQYQSAIPLLKTILEKNYYLEEIHRMVLITYISDGDYTSFINHYRQVKNTFKKELGIGLEASTEELYNELYIEKFR